MYLLHSHNKAVEDTKAAANEKANEVKEAAKEKANKSIDDALAAKGAGFTYTAAGEDYDDMFSSCYKSASLLISCLQDAGTVDALSINYSSGHFTPEKIKSTKKNGAFSEAPTYHIIYLVRSNMGLYNLYHIPYLYLV